MRHLSLLLLLLAASAHADDDAAAWLERMSQAVHTRNYVGTFVYMQEGGLETMQLVHARNETGEHERLLTLSGPSREVVREHGQVTCYLPEQEALVAERPPASPSFPFNLPTHWEKLHHVYDFKVLGLSRIAGQVARQIAIMPRDRFRYGQNYWIDSDSHMLLRADVVNEQGKVVEQLEFTSLRLLDEVPPQLLRPEAGSRAVELAPQQAASKAQAPQRLHWRVASLPPGFVLELQRLHAIAEGGEPVTHLIYSDGLASVSVFIEPRHDGDETSAGTSRRGSVNAYTRLMPQQRVTVLGEVPLATVEQIAQSIMPLER